MLPYWLMYFMVSVGALANMAPFNRRQLHPVLIAMVLLIIVFVGLRFEVGADWFNYLYMYDYIGSRSLESSLKAGDFAYVYLNWLANRWGAEIWFVNIVCAAVFGWGLYRLAVTQDNPFTILAIAIPYLVIAIAMGYTRQGAALGMVMAALADYLKHKNLWRFTLFIFGAALFHSSAVIVLALVALTEKRSSVVNFIVLACAGLIAYTTLAMPAIEKIQAVYLQRQYQSQGALVRILMSNTSAIAFLIFRRHLNFSPTERLIWRNFGIASFVALIALFVVQSSALVDRLALYLMPLQLVIFGRISTLGGRNVSSLIVILITFGLVLFVWLNFAANSFMWQPYQSYLFQ